MPTTSASTTPSSVGLSSGFPSNSIDATTPTTTSTVPTSTNPAPLIFVAIDSVSVNLGRRQVLAVPTFVAPDGTLTNNCGAAAQYNIANGQLFNAAGGQYSTNTGTANTPLAASKVVGDITTTFTAGGILTWANATFTNGVAIYCTLASGQILAVFDSAPPAGCTPVVLKTTTCAAVAAGAAGAAGNGAAAGTIINIGAININNYKLNNSQLALDGGIIDQFNTGTINFYSGDSTYYYAQICLSSAPSSKSSRPTTSTPLSHAPCAQLRSCNART